jgi:hypothetical protein
MVVSGKAYNEIMIFLSSHPRYVFPSPTIFFTRRNKKKSGEEGRRVCFNSTAKVLVI